MTSLSAEDAPRAEAPGEVACAHCRLPVPAGLVRPGESRQFCCEGCRAVDAAIRGCGLDQFYALREREGGTFEPARPVDRAFEEFDDPAFARQYVRDTCDGLRGVELYVEGVHCAACLWLIERLPMIQPGVAEARLDFGRHVVRILFDPDAVPLSTIARRLASLGYAPRPYRGRAMQSLRREEDRRYLVRLAVAGAIAGNVMLIAFALYGGMFHGMDAQFRALFHWVSLGLTVIALAWPGRVFFTGAFAALRHGVVHMDVPVAVGLAAGLLLSAANTIRGTGEVYFDSVSILVFLLLAGRWIQVRQQRRSLDAVEMLFSLTPSAARRIEDGRPRDVPIESLAPGDLVEVAAGESIPADATVERGRSEINRALLTGESRPVAVTTGDVVHAGTTNLSSPLRLRVLAAGESTRVGQLMRLVEASAARRAPIVRLADRLAARFVVIVLVLALATALLWWRLDPARALPSAISLLIITCPCALGLATPLAIVAAVGRATRRGILIKGGQVLEALAGHGTIVFDKTGTLTEGRLAVVAWDGPESLRPLVAAVESASAHPIARALAALDDPDLPAATDVEETRGLGITGRVENRTLHVGSLAHLERHGIDISPEWRRRVDALVADGMTPVTVAADGRLEALAGLADPVRDDAAAAIETLRTLGWTPSMLSGDHPGVATRVGAALGIETEQCRGGVSPERKLEIVEDEARRGRVVMVGDGVNDAAALAAATVGVSVRGGAEASLAAADVYLGAPGLQPLVELVRGARRTVGVIRMNLGVSLLYNVVGASLAMAGLVNPLVAAVLMPLSSLTVLTLSSRLTTFGSAA